MNLRLLFSRHARHLWILGFLIVASGAGAFFAREIFVPADYGDLGPYRASALDDIASDPMIFTADNKCLQCHSDVGEAREDSPHKAVACMHCHGNGHEHMKLALAHAEDDSVAIPPAAEWDGDFRTHLDLFVTLDRATCLSCHTRVVGMPASFRSIIVAEHLEEQGAEDVNGRNVCFECHDGHSPGL